MTTCGYKATDWRTDKKTSLLWNRDIYWFFPIYSYVFISFDIFQKSYDITSYNSVPSSTVFRKSICWMLCYDFDNHFLFHRNDAASICLEEISLMNAFETSLQRSWAQHTSNLKTITLHAPTSFSFWYRIRFMSNIRTYSMGQMTVTKNRKENFNY